jgi:hypothetical protein
VQCTAHSAQRAAQSHQEFNPPAFAASRDVLVAWYSAIAWLGSAVSTVAAAISVGDGGSGGKVFRFIVRVLGALTLPWTVAHAPPRYTNDLVPAIGVSNFTIKHLHQLQDTAKVTPTVNQIECHPYLQQTALVEFCQRHTIHVMAYCPLGSGAHIFLFARPCIHVVMHSCIVPF